MSARSRSSRANRLRFAVCVDNDGYEASLERNKIYVVLPDRDAESDGDLRVVDESGEDADERASGGSNCTPSATSITGGVSKSGNVRGWVDIQ